MPFCTLFIFVMSFNKMHLSIENIRQCGKCQNHYNNKKKTQCHRSDETDKKQIKWKWRKQQMQHQFHQTKYVLYLLKYLFKIKPKANKKYVTITFNTNFYVYETARILGETLSLQHCDWFQLCNIHFILQHQHILYNIYSCCIGMRQQYAR